MYSMMRLPLRMARAANTPAPCTLERRTLVSGGLPAFTLAIVRPPLARRWPHDADSSRIQSSHTDSRILFPDGDESRAWVPDKGRAQAAHQLAGSDSRTGRSRRPSR